MKTFSGALLSLDIVGELRADERRARTLCSVVARAFDLVGPASSARHIADVFVRPLSEALALDSAVIADTGEFVAFRAAEGAALVAGAWDADLRRLREASRRCTPAGTRWWIGINGRRMVVIDSSTAYTRRSAVVDLQALAEDMDGAAAVSALLERNTAGALDTMERAVTRSEEHRTAVGRTLQAGVELAVVRLADGLRRGARRLFASDAAMAEALTVIYRILFLLFAEARGLVPQWHPIYRDAYTIESLRAAVEPGGRPVGVWDAIQAISRLAHRGCRAGSLRVTPFNGRLFAPASTPMAETAHLSDAAAADALLALTTRPSGRGRARISYADLGVEQLGAVYEGVLDFTTLCDDSGVRLVRTGRRKATGTFYTPRSMTEYLVRRTLAPLAETATPERLLSLRVLDPAMGSGAFLVAACRYLADAYERALVREGAARSADLSPADRAGFRRSIAQRCVYGVDRNPTAVQLARLSLWLCTLAADRPLTFLDHHLRSGNSLVGASPADTRRQPPIRLSKGTRGALPLFADDELHASLGSTVNERVKLATTPDDSVETVRRKERVAAALDSQSAPLGSWRTRCDAWCGAWFTDGPMTARLWGALEASFRGEEPVLPPDVHRRWRGLLDAAVAREQPFHWELEFPEAFYGSDGASLEDPGFDAVLGNPPWDMLRGADSAALSSFARQSGCFGWHSEGHLNLYQLFTERMLRLTRRQGRFGLLVPSGLTGDYGSSELRRVLFERCEVDALMAFDNRGAIFPIHRGIKFVLLTGTRGGTTAALPARFGLHGAATLDDVPDTGTPPDAVPIPVSLMREFSGDGLAVPELGCDADRAILAGILARTPRLGADDGWDAQFGRELNATDDKPLFGVAGLPVLEGKLIEPFAAHVEHAASFIDDARAAYALGGRPHARPRLGYREVASSSNRLTLIAAVIPAMCVTTHTIFCLKTALPIQAHWFLCGVFNSFVANYLVRLRGGTHVPAAAIHRLPVPVLPYSDERFRRIAAGAERLSMSFDAAAAAEVNARVADLYQLTRAELRHVLSTFPLVDREAIDGAARAFEALFSAV